MSSRSPQKPHVTPHGSSAFEHVVRRLGLSPSQYALSRELKEWVRRHKDEKYVSSLPPGALTLMTSFLERQQSFHNVPPKSQHL